MLQSQRVQHHELTTGIDLTRWTRGVGLAVAVGVVYFVAARLSLALLTKPGLWLQRITTQPPSDEMAQCAITALDRAMALEKERGGELVIA